MRARKVKREKRQREAERAREQQKRESEARRKKVITPNKPPQSSKPGYQPISVKKEEINTQFQLGLTKEQLDIVVMEKYSVTSYLPPVYGESARRELMADYNRYLTAYLPEHCDGATPEGEKRVNTSNMCSKCGEHLEICTCGTEKRCGGCKKAKSHYTCDDKACR